MNERVVPKITNFCVVKLSNSPANTQHKEVPVPRRQDVDERPCVPRLELNGPALRHFESQPDSPRINQRLLNLRKLAFVIPTPGHSGLRAGTESFENGFSAVGRFRCAGPLLSQD